MESNKFVLFVSKSVKRNISLKRFFSKVKGSKVKVIAERDDTQIVGDIEWMHQAGENALSFGGQKGQARLSLKVMQVDSFRPAEKEETELMGEVQVSNKTVKFHEECLRVTLQQKELFRDTDLAFSRYDENYQFFGI